VTDRANVREETAVPVVFCRPRSLMRLLGAVAWLVLAGCGEDAGEQPSSSPDDGSAGSEVRVFVGELEGSDVKLGAVVATGRARLFFCGGPTSYAERTRWLEVELDERARFELDQDDWHVRGQLVGTSLSGELEHAAAAAAAFDAELARRSTLAGLYEGTADCGRVGLIVSQRDQDAPAAGQGACVGPGHAPEQVNPILPISLQDDGSIRVEVEAGDGSREARVTAAAPP
jgi:hypothetical protein